MDFVDSLLDVQSFVDDTATATWRTSVVAACFQWFLIGIFSLISQSIPAISYTVSLWPSER